MSPNLAAAVELSNGEALAISLQQMIDANWHLHGPLPDDAIELLRRTIAELGSGAGEPKHVFEIPVDRYDWTEDGMEIIPKNQSGPNEYVKYDDYEKLYNTRPPVAGLAELTPKQWRDLYEAIANTNLSDDAIFTAGREFLGKVE